jgi:hypothetical protein
MTCNCIETVNEKLASRNTRLTQAMIFGEHANPGLMLETEQVEKGRGKQKAVGMFPTYCPFCGVKYGGDA